VHFAGDTESALVFAASLVNTARGGAELLPDQEELTRFLDADRWTGRRDGTPEELTAVRALRPRLRKFWEAAGVDDAVEVVDPDGRVFAKGLVRHPSARVAEWAGRRSADLPPELSAVIVHRDDLVVLGD